MSSVMGMHSIFILAFFVCINMYTAQNVTTVPPVTVPSIFSNVSQVVNLTFSLPTGGRFLGALKWLKLLALKGGNKDDGFFGRCLGAARRLKFVMPFILFKLGVIVTTLAFLTLFAMKGISVGVLLLALNAAGFLGKAALFKALSYKEAHAAAPQPIPQTQPAVHLHVHKDGDGNYNLQQPSAHATKYFDYMPTAWSERVSKGLSESQSIAEKLELINLYNRLGLNVNHVLRQKADGGNIIYPQPNERD